MNWLRINWQVKLVALFLAVALWFYTSGQSRIEKAGITVKIPERAVLALPRDYRITSIVPDEFTIDIEGPMTVLRSIKGDELIPTLVINAAALAEGKQTFPITNRVLGLDADARIQRTSLPETLSGITVTFGRIVEERFWLEVPRLVDVPAGIEPTLSMEIDRLERVQGPKNVIDALLAQKRLRFQPVSLARVDPLIDKEKTLRVQLVPDVPESVVVPPVHATIVLKPVVAAGRVVSLPLNLLVPPDFSRRYQVELSQQQVAVTLRGPQNLIENLAPDALTAYVNLRRPPNELNKPEEVDVSVITPAYATHDPLTVRVTWSVAAARPVAEPAPTVEVEPPGNGR